MDSLSEIRSTWAAVAGGVITLPGTRPIRNYEYANSLMDTGAIRYPASHVFAGAVIARYKYAIDIEQGYPQFDMKPGLLKGSKSRKSKKGKKYNIVPFRWATPNTPASSGAFSGRMPAAVYKQAQRQTITMQTLHNIDQQQGTSYSQTKTSFTGYQHAAPLLLGLQANQGTRQQGHAAYRTFRTVSHDSDPRSWIHPAQPPNPIMQSVIAATTPTIEKRITQAIEADLQNMLL